METWVKVDLLLEQNEAQPSDLAPEGDEGRGAAQTALARGQVVRLSVRIAASLHDRVEQQPAEFRLAFLGQLASAAKLTRLTDPDIHSHESDECVVIAEIQTALSVTKWVSGRVN